MKYNCRTEIFLHSLQLGLWIYAEPTIDGEINVKTEWTWQFNQSEGLRSWQVCNRGKFECLTTNARQCSSEKMKLSHYMDLLFSNYAVKERWVSLTAKQISSYTGL